MEFYCLTGRIQTSEATLHQAHDVSSDYLTRRDGDAVTRGFLSLLLGVCASPRLRDCSVTACLAQARTSGKQNVETRTLSQRPQHFIRNGFRRIFVDLATANAAVGYSHPSVKQTQVIKNFCLRADRRARIARRVFLTNGDRGGDAAHFVNVGLVHALEKLARVG